MGNFLLFLSSFIHYLWAFGLSIVLIVVACIIGVKWRKSKDAKETVEKSEEVLEN